MSDFVTSALAAQRDFAQRRTGRLTTPSNHQEAYRQYLLTVSPFNGSVSIKRDGYHIAYAADLTEAKGIVDKIA